MEKPAAPQAWAEVKMKRLRDKARLPDPATPGSAGVDLRACLDAPMVLVPPGGRMAVPTGLAMEIDAPGLAGFVYSRSGLGAKRGLTVAQGVGVIDPDYRGEIMVWLLNTTDTAQTVADGQRVAQLIIQPFFEARLAEAEELSQTERGSGGFGHTGDM